MIPAHEPDTDEMVACSARLGEALLDAYASGGPEAIRKVKHEWMEKASQLPTLKQKRKARIVMQMAFARITHGTE